MNRADGREIFWSRFRVVRAPASVANVLKVGRDEAAGTFLRTRSSLREISTCFRRENKRKLTFKKMSAKKKLFSSN